MEDKLRILIDLIFWAQKRTSLRARHSRLPLLGLRDLSRRQVKCPLMLFYARSTNKDCIAAFFLSLHFFPKFSIFTIPIGHLIFILTCNDRGAIKLSKVKKY